MKLFVSHSDKDRPLANSIESRLKEWGHQVFVSSSHTNGILGGHNWERTIMQELQESSAVLLCCTPDARNSQWTFAEVLLARFQGKAVYPLLMRGDRQEIWDFLTATVQVIDFTSDPDRGYELLKETLNDLEHSATPPGQTDLNGNWECYWLSFAQPSPNAPVWMHARVALTATATRVGGNFIVEDAGHPLGAALDCHLSGDIHARRMLLRDDRPDLTFMFFPDLRKSPLVGVRGGLDNLYRPFMTPVILSSSVLTASELSQAWEHGLLQPIPIGDYPMYGQP